MHMIPAAIALALAAQAPPAGPQLRATFIGNEGFHITDGRIALLVDFPYVPGAFGYMQWGKENVPPGPRPLCLVSHAHEDHFSPRLAKEYCAILVAPPEAVQMSGVT